MLGPKELEPQRVGKQRSRGQRRDCGTLHERPCATDHLSWPEQRVAPDEDRDREGRIEQQLLPDQRLPGDQEPEDGAPPDERTAVAQFERLPHDERDQELGDHLRVPVRMVDHARRETGEATPDEGGQPSGDQMRGQHVVPGPCGTGQANRHEEHQGDRRTEQQGHRYQGNGQPEQADVGDLVHPEWRVQLRGEERVLTVGEDPARMHQRPLKDLRVVGIRGWVYPARVAPHALHDPHREQQVQPDHGQVRGPLAPRGCGGGHPDPLPDRRRRCGQHCRSLPIAQRIDHVDLQ